MNYQIINDREKLDQFVHWLPELQKHEVFFMSLFARSKYVTTNEEKFIKNNTQTQLRRLTVTKDLLVTRIKQMECPIGSYTKNGKTIPQESLALYINPNPRDLIKAGKNLIIRLNDLCYKPYNGFNAQIEAMSMIQKTASKKLFLDLDFDLDDSNMHKMESIMNDIKIIAGKHCAIFLKTRGGFHALIRLAHIDKDKTQTWYNEITSLEGLDIKGDSLMPIPGCTQGNFTPHFIQ